MDISSQMLLFVKVVDLGSISAASRAMGQTPSAVSKQISLLEDQVRYRLLNRTRDGVSPTAEGSEFYLKCKALAERFDEVEAHIQSLDGRPRGELKVASSVAFGKAQLIPRLRLFLDANPDVKVSLELTDRDVDLEAEGFDVAICIAEQRKKPDVIVRRITQSQRVLCASPAYLQCRGTPSSFVELAQHNCLRIAGSNERNEWIRRENGNDVSFEAIGNFEGNSSDAIYRATLAGLGIARLPCHLVSKDIQYGDLVRVLPDYSQQNAEIAVVFASKRNLAPRVRVFVDFVAYEFRDSSDHLLSGF